MPHELNMRLINTTTLEMHEFFEDKNSRVCDPLIYLGRRGGGLQRIHEEAQPRSSRMDENREMLRVCAEARTGLRVD